jgi:hypothetical protein
MQTYFECHVTSSLLTHLFSSPSFSIFNLRLGKKEEIHQKLKQTHVEQQAEEEKNMKLCVQMSLADKWSLKANKSDSLTAKHEIGK